MVSSRAKTPSGAAEAIPMPTEMDSRVVDNERRDGAMVGKAAENERRMVTMAGRAVENERRNGAMVGRAAENERRMVAMADGTTAETGRAVETASHRERG